MKSKIKILAFLTVLLAITLIVPMAKAENGNVTPVTTPFITIDPIGNHSIGDVFFINGTTNLSVTENLTMYIVSSRYFEAPHQKTDTAPNPNDAESITNILISQTLPETNRNHWSVNVTEAVKTLTNKEYLVFVHVQYPCHNSGCNYLTMVAAADTVAVSDFVLFPANNSATFNVLQTTVQSSSPIQSPTRTGTVSLPTQSSSLPHALPIITLAGILILSAIYGKKRD